MNMKNILEGREEYHIPIVTMVHSTIVPIALFDKPSRIIGKLSFELYVTQTYMQKTCDVAEKAILAKKKLRKKCVNCDKM